VDQAVSSVKFSNHSAEIFAIDAFRLNDFIAKWLKKREKHTEILYVLGSSWLHTVVNIEFVATNCLFAKHTGNLDEKVKVTIWKVRSRRRVDSPLN